MVVLGIKSERSGRLSDETPSTPAIAAVDSAYWSADSPPLSLPLNNPRTFLLPVHLLLH